MTRSADRDRETPRRAASLGCRVASLVGFAAHLACSHVAPQELVDARVAFDRAAYGPAGTYLPIELGVAHSALAGAQELFQATGDTPRVRDSADNARRLAELVEAMARITLFNDANARRFAAEARSIGVEGGVQQGAR